MKVYNLPCILLWKLMINALTQLLGFNPTGGNIFYLLFQNILSLVNIKQCIAFNLFNAYNEIKYFCDLKELDKG